MLLKVSVGFINSWGLFCLWSKSVKYTIICPMKLEAKFKSADNRLYSLDGQEITVDSQKKISLGDGSGERNGLFFVDLPWSQVGMDEDSYNEEFLASMRDMLKNMEDSGAWAVMVPVADDSLDSESKKTDFIASMKHSARRIKDCASVVGYVIPADVDQSTFVEELSAKHGHYIFFSSNPDTLKNGSVVKF